MRFPYYAYPLDSPDPITGQDFLYRPILPVRLALPGQPFESVYYQALVDSGADWCLFDERLGERAGLRLKEGEPHRFVGVELVPSMAYFHQVTLEVGSFRTVVRVGFVEKWRFPCGLLGQFGFFDRFVVTLHNGSGQRFTDVELPQMGGAR